MMKTSVSTTHLHGLSRQMGLPVREVDSTQPANLPLTPLVQLFLKLQQVRPEGRGAVVQFITVTPGCKSEHLALDMAWAAVSSLGKKILILNGNKHMQKPYLPGTGPTTTQGHAEAERTVSPVSLSENLVKVHGLNLYVANLHDAYGGNKTLVALDEIAGTLRELALSFDMIVVVAPPVDEDPLTTALAAHMDGNVLVVEAERTRRPAALRAAEAVVSSGGVIVGTVLNNQRAYAARLHS